MRLLTARSRSDDAKPNTRLCAPMGRMNKALKGNVGWQSTAARTPSPSNANGNAPVRHMPMTPQDRAHVRSPFDKLRAICR